MIVNIVIMYIVFPLVCVLGIERKRGGNDTFQETQLLSKDDSDYIKGFAAISVLLAHYCVRLSEENRLLTILAPYQYLGPLGVALFFFLSGYGIYVGNGFGRLNIGFLIKRIKNVYIPFVIIRICCIPFLNVLGISNDTFSDVFLFLLGIKGVFWYIIVIMCLYMIYYLVSQLPSCNLVKIGLLALAILGFSAYLYKIMGLDQSYWYGNNMIFPLGVLFGYFRKDIKKIIDSYAVLIFLSTVICFMILAILFFVTEDLVKVFIKFLIGSTLCLIFTQVLQKVNIMSPQLHWVGKHSLYIYLIQTYIYKIMRNCLDMSSSYISVLYFIITIVVAAIFKLCIDYLFGLLNDIGHQTK